MPESYKWSDVLLVAKVGSGTSADADDANQAIRQWDFEVVDLFKGNVSFGKLWSEGSSASCGVDLDEGVTYLISTDESGRISLCGVREANNPVTKAQIGLLSMHKAGVIPLVTEPWFFTQTSKMCNLTHRFSSLVPRSKKFLNYPVIGGPVFLMLQFRFYGPSNLHAQKYGWLGIALESEHKISDDLQEYSPLSSQVGRIIAGIGSSDSGNINPTGRLILGDREWFANEEMSWELHLYDPWAVVFGEEDTKQILAELTSASSGSIVWQNSDGFDRPTNGDAQYMIESGTTDHLYFGSSLAEFSECIKSAQSRPR